MVTLLLCLLSVDPRYHTYAQTAAELRGLADQYPSLCRLETIGVSTTQQLPLLCLKVSDHPDQREDEPRILFNGVHHACELIGNEVCLYLARDLLTRYATAPDVRRWVDSNQTFIVPILNPDGHAINMNDLDTMWRKNLHDFNRNGLWDPDSDGVDLNRNYDFLWTVGDSNHSSRAFRGESPFSENETRALRELAEREKFIFDVCFHSSIDLTQGEAVYYPWRWGNSWCPDYPEVKTIADSVARRILNDRGTMPYATIYGRATEGGLARNWLYHALGTFAYTIEVSLGYQPPGYRVDSICERVSGGVHYLFDRAHGAGITGHVTDSVTGEPLVAEVKVLEATSSPDTIAARVSDSLAGRYWRVLSLGSYTVEFTKYGYYPKQIAGVTTQPGRPTLLDVVLTRNPAVQESRFVRRPAMVPSIEPRSLSGRAVGLKYGVPAAGSVRLDVFDLSGRRVRELAQGWSQAGEYYVTWDRRTDRGESADAGVYFIHLQASGQSVTCKVVTP